MSRKHNTRPKANLDASKPHVTLDTSNPAASLEVTYPGLRTPENPVLSGPMTVDNDMDFKQFSDASIRASLSNPANSAAPTTLPSQHLAIGDVAATTDGHTKFPFTQNGGQPNVPRSAVSASGNVTGSMSGCAPPASENLHIFWRLLNNVGYNYHGEDDDIYGEPGISFHYGLMCVTLQTKAFSKLLSPITVNAWNKLSWEHDLRTRRHDFLPLTRNTLLDIQMHYRSVQNFRANAPEGDEDYISHMDKVLAGIQLELTTAQNNVRAAEKELEGSDKQIDKTKKRILASLHSTMSDHYNKLVEQNESLRQRGLLRVEMGPARGRAETKLDMITVNRSLGRRVASAPAPAPTPAPAPPSALATPNHVDPVMMEEFALAAAAEASSSIFGEDTIMEDAAAEERDFLDIPSIRTLARPASPAPFCTEAFIVQPVRMPALRQLVLQQPENYPVRRHDRATRSWRIPHQQVDGTAPKSKKRPTSTLGRFLAGEGSAKEAIAWKLVVQAVGVAEWSGVAVLEEGVEEES